MPEAIKSPLMAQDSALQLPENRRILEDREEEIKLNEKVLQDQYSTPIPAIYTQYYKFIQNPSTVSVETFRRMIDTDETIGSGVEFLQTCLAARIGQYIHKSDEITEYVNAVLEKIKGGFYSALKGTMDAAWAGFSVQEKIWANDPEYGFIMGECSSIPAATVLFETELSGRLTPLGILQYQQGYFPGFGYGTAGGLLGFQGGGLFGYPDPLAKFGDYPYPLRTGVNYSYMTQRIPVEKCIHVAFNGPGNYQNPYGRSILRRAYKWWVSKDAYVRMMSVALDRKGTPLLVVFADGNSTIIDRSKVNSAADARGNASAGISAAAAAANAFGNIHNDSTIILPGRKDQVYSLQEVGRGANADDFIAAIKHADSSMLRALLIPSLIFTNGDGTGSYALGQEHSRTWDKILDGMGDPIKDAWIHQYVKQLLQYNFPESAWKKDGFGAFSKRELSQDERAKEMEIIEKGVNTGSIDHSDLKDLNQTREKIGYSPRTKPIIQEREEGLDGAGAEGQGKSGDDTGGEEE